MTLSDDELHALAIPPRIKRLRQEICELSIGLKLRANCDWLDDVDVPTSDEIIDGIETRRQKIEELQGDDR